MSYNRVKRHKVKEKIMLKSLNLKHIFYFWVVGKEGSIKKASTLLNVAQSSISEQVRLLEDRVGIDLFDRTQKKMNLSSNGKVLFQTLDKFFPNLEELFESMVNHKSTNVKFLRIGLCPTISAELKFRLCFPFIEDIKYTVKALQGENSFLSEAYDNDEIDLLFTTNATVPIHGKFEKQEVSNKTYSIVTNKNVYKNLPRTNKIKALSSIKFINYTSDSDLHFKIIDFLHEQEISPIRIAEIDDINLTRKTLLNLDCFAIVPTNSVQMEIEKKELFQVGAPIKSLNSKIYAYYKPSFKSESFFENLEKAKKKHIKQP